MVKVRLVHAPLTGRWYAMVDYGTDGFQKVDVTIQMEKIFEGRLPHLDKHYNDFPIPLETPVTITKDDGTKLETVTRGPIRVLPSGDAIIFAKGISGGYLLDRARIRAPSPLSPTWKDRLPHLTGPERDILKAVDTMGGNFESSGALYTVYERQVGEEHIGTRQASNVLRSLEDQGFLELEVKNKGRHGRTTRGDLVMPLNELRLAWDRALPDPLGGQE